MARGVRSKHRKGLNTLKRVRLQKAEAQRMERIAKRLAKDTGVDVHDLQVEMPPITAEPPKTSGGTVKVTQLRDDDMVVDDLPVDPNEKPKVRSGGVNKPAWKLKRKRARAEEKHSTRRSAKFY